MPASPSLPELGARRATAADIPLLASLNQQLIQDEGHRNPMTLSELAERMRGWLAGDYVAHLFTLGGEPVAYALWRDDGDAIYLRHLLVVRAHRRAGIGRAALRLLREDLLPPGKRLTVEVLVTNEVGRRFWEAIGFTPYALTLEMMPEERRR